MEALPEKWQNVNCSMQTCDAQILSGNTKNVAVITGAGKNVTVLKHGEYGRIPSGYPVFCGHKGNILDVEFVPYYDDYFATCAEDGLIKLWQVPEKQEGEINNSLSTLQGHSKKVNVLSFNASSKGVLASTGLDRTIRIWDIQESCEKVQLFGSQTDYAVDLDWKISGNLLGSTWKDKKYRIYDARQQESIHCFNAHEGSKPSKFTWMGDYSYFITAGFSKGQQSREFKFWDLKKPDAPISTMQIDKDMSIIYPTFDGNLDILYFTGKGDSMIRYFDFKDGQFERYSNDHRCSVPGKSFAFIKNYGLNTESMEIARCLQVSNNNDILQVSVKQPKRGTGFQEDLYPPTAKGYGQTAAQFFSGSDAEPLKMSMNPDDSASQVNYSQVLEISGVQQEAKPVQKPVQQQQQQQQAPVQQQQQQQSQPPVQKQNPPPQATTTTTVNNNVSSDNNEQVQKLEKELETQRNNYEQQIQQLREENESLRQQLNSQSSDQQQDSKQQILLSINEQLTNLRDIVNDIEQNS